MKYPLGQHNGLILEKDGEAFRLTDYFCEHYGYAAFGGCIKVVYEEKDGALILCNCTQCGIKKEILLCSRKHTFQNREIRLEEWKDSLYLFFSAIYKQKKMILVYRKAVPVRIFDACDAQPFQTLSLDDGIIVLYQKGGQWGYSILKEDNVRPFQPIAATNPVKLFFHQTSIWLLCFEKRYVLYNLSQNKSYPLPLVFYKKPFLTFLENAIEIRYRFQHKNIVYLLKDGEINFLCEED